MEEVTEQYTKEFKEENTQELDKVFNLEDENDRVELNEELTSNSMYFKPVEGVTYKIELTSPQVRRIEKTFDDDKVVKYEISLKAKGSDKSTFEGVWETGKTVIEAIFKNYEKGAVFTVSKSGTGQKTRYSVNKDF